MKRIMIITRIAIITLTITLVAAACMLPAQNDLVPKQPIYEESADAARIPVSIAVGAPHVPVYLNFDLAQALGYFAAEGLDVDLQYFEGGSDAVAEQVAALDEAGQEALVREILTKLGCYIDDDGLAAPYETHVVLARGQG